MRKKFAIFCDGTWQSLRNQASTNVVKLARSVADRSADGCLQLTYYEEGVGIGSNISLMSDVSAKYLGGALGRGLDAKIERAYQFIVLNFEPDDEIFVFGFSRGAYTARSLCGLIRKCGIVRRDAFDQVPVAMDHYRDPIAPASPQMVEFRQQFTHRLSAGLEDRAELGISDADVHAAAKAQPNRAELYQYRPDKTYRIAYAGIWDTVGAMGVPRKLDWLALDRDYDFHDTKGSSLVASIRHAIAANEERELFDSTPYDNIDELNATWATATGWNVVDPENERFVPYRLRPYQQTWFPGDHGSIGGGYTDSSLSNCALSWIAEGAEWAGLCFSDDQRLPYSGAKTHRNPFGPLGRNGAITAPHGEIRARGPASADEISDELWHRLEKDFEYRPANLKHYLERPASLPEPTGFPAPFSCPEPADAG